jgi:hypothetical protein
MSTSTSSHQIRYEVHCGTISEKHIQELMPLRLQLFYGYPYLFSGNAEEESHRWKSTPQNSTILVLAYDADALVGALLAYTDDASHYPALKKLPQYNPQSSLYIEFTMVIPRYERREIARELFKLFEAEASRKGYTDAYDITVIRSQHHPLKSENDIDCDIDGREWGLQKTHIYEPLVWATRCGTPGNEFVTRIDNMVEYWHKQLR